MMIRCKLNKKEVGLLNQSVTFLHRKIEVYFAMLRDKVYGYKNTIITICHRQRW